MENKKEMFEELMKAYAVLNVLFQRREGYGQFFELYGRHVIGKLIAKYFKEEIRPYLDTDGSINSDKAEKRFSNKLKADKERFVEEFSSIDEEAGDLNVYFSFETGKLFIAEHEDCDEKGLDSSALKTHLEKLLAGLMQDISGKVKPEKMH